MGDMERLHRIKYLIQARQCVPLEDFLEELEISKATFKRDLEYLRSRMNANIVYDRIYSIFLYAGLCLYSYYYQKFEVPLLPEPTNDPDWVIRGVELAPSSPK